LHSAQVHFKNCRTIEKILSMGRVHKKWLHSVYYSPNIQVIRSRRMRVGMWSIWQRGERHTGFLWGNLKERDNLEDVDTRIILNGS